jgi:hypothetical protein
MEELVTLYLGEHPEDERYFGSQVMCAGGEGLHAVMTYPAAIRFSRWGVENGWFDQENHERLVALLEKNT